MVFELYSIRYAIVNTVMVVLLFLPTQIWYSSEPAFLVWGILLVTQSIWNGETYSFPMSWNAEAGY
jgi:hypothetical protein